jgi:hypothetical protein
MKFSSDLWDALFGKKVIMEIPSPTGKIIKRKVSKKWLEKMKDEGQVKEIKDAMIRVHMINPVSGISVGYWTIGKDIDEATVNEFRDPETGDLYALTSFKNGEPKISVLRKDLWEKSKKLMDSV